MAGKSNSWSPFLRYQAQAERHGAPSGPRAAGEFERLKTLREELPNEANFEAQPEQNETTCTPSETNPSAPENPAPAPGPPASASAPDPEPAGASGVLATPRPAGPDIAGEDWSLPEHRGGALS